MLFGDKAEPTSLRYLGLHPAVEYYHLLHAGAFCAGIDGHGGIVGRCCSQQYKIWDYQALVGLWKLASMVWSRQLAAYGRCRLVVMAEGPFYGRI